MSAQPTLDLRVTIDRVRVRTAALSDARPRPVLLTGYLDGRAGVPLHEHGIVIRELRIDVEAVLDAAAARRLGHRVASDLVAQLGELQDQRQARILAKPASCGPIYIETLLLQLRGEPELHPPSHQIAAALMGEVEQRVSHGR
ncbi:MAG: hypothetical protein ABIY55_13710 [Kofleriaceae bacterium]